MSDTAAAEWLLFEGGPPRKLQSWLGLVRAGNAHVVRRALLSVAIAWLPLVVLTGIRGDLLRADWANSFILDFGAHTRFLIATPLLILAESICVYRLAAIARQFVRSGLIAEADRFRYEKAVSSTRRLTNSTVAEVLAPVLAYGFVAMFLFLKLSVDVPLWRGTVRAGALTPSPAGWWSMLVSTPILLILLFGWIWRVCLWTRFLWLMNRIELRLIPSHPDRAGGLKFVGISLEGFTPLAFAMGVIGAGPAINRVLQHGASPLEFKYQIVGVVAFVLVLFAGPLLLFARRLLHEQHRGILEYGGLTARLGEQFERKWLMMRQALNKGALEVPDFSATTDLNSITANVYAMYTVPLDLKRLILLAGAALLPFLPLVLLVAPLNVILKKVVDVLL